MPAVAAGWSAVPERAFGAGFIRFAFHDPPVGYKKIPLSGGAWVWVAWFGFQSVSDASIPVAHAVRVSSAAVSVHSVCCSDQIAKIHAANAPVPVPAAMMLKSVFMAAPMVGR